jgi:hypothetical protein
MLQTRLHLAPRSLRPARGHPHPPSAATRRSSPVKPLSPRNNNSREGKLPSLPHSAGSVPLRLLLFKKRDLGAESGTERDGPCFSGGRVLEGVFAPPHMFLLGVARRICRVDCDNALNGRYYYLLLSTAVVSWALLLSVPTPDVVHGASECSMP